MEAQGATEPDSRDVSLTIPARPDYLVLARLALAAVCRLTPLSPEEIADLKLAITEAANDFVDDSRAGRGRGPRRASRSGSTDERLLMELDGPGERGRVGRARAEPRDHRRDRRRVHVRAAGRTQLVKYLSVRPELVSARVLQPVSVGTKSLADYTHLAGKPLIEEVRELAEPLKGLRVLHVSATAFGGGVSEILYTLIPLMNDVGIEAEWQVMLGREEFYNATKRLHNALQGNPDSLVGRGVGRSSIATTS